MRSEVLTMIKGMDSVVEILQATHGYWEHLTEEERLEIFQSVRKLINELEILKVDLLVEVPDEKEYRH